MSKLKGLAVVLTGVAALAPAAAGLPEIEIDCDRGDRLQKAVDYLAEKGGGIVRMTGTCRRVHVDSPFIRIVGDSPATSIIDAGLGTAVSTVDPGRLEIAGVRLVGGQGVHATGSRRVVLLDDCEIEATSIGIRVASAEVFVADSDVSGARYAIRNVGGLAAAERSVLHDGEYGARVFEGDLFLTDTVVTSSELFGVAARDRSTVEIRGGSFSNNGIEHLRAGADSRIFVLDAAIGAPDDPTLRAVAAADGASVSLVGGDPSIEIWRNAIVSRDSYFEIDGPTFHGSVHLGGFSRLVLNSTVTGGSVLCESAADAVCREAASAATRDCRSAPPSCEPLVGAAPETGPSPAPQPFHGDTGRREREHPSPRGTPADR